MQGVFGFVTTFNFWCILWLTYESILNAVQYWHCVDVVEGSVPLFIVSIQAVSFSPRVTRTFVIFLLA